MRLITQLLQRTQSGDAYAHDALYATSYRELHALAQRHMQDDGAYRVLHSAGLVHDCCLAFAARAEMNGGDWPAFLAFAPVVVRTLILDLIEHCARERRRGGSALHLRLRPAVAPCLPGDEATVLWMDRAIEALEAREARLAQVARMQYLCGYTTEETADALRTTQRAVQRDWLRVVSLLSAEHVPGTQFLPTEGWAARWSERAPSGPAGTGGPGSRRTH